MLDHLRRALTAALVGLLFAAVGAGVGMLVTPQVAAGGDCTWTQTVN